MQNLVVFTRIGPHAKGFLPVLELFWPSLPARGKLLRGLPVPRLFLILGIFLLFLEWGFLVFSKGSPLKASQEGSSLVAPGLRWVRFEPVVAASSFSAREAWDMNVDVECMYMSGLGIMYARNPIPEGPTTRVLTS